MLYVFVGVMTGLILGAIATSPIIPGDQIPLEKVTRQQVFEILSIAVPAFGAVMMVYYHQKWIPALRGVAKKLPGWMLKEF